MDIVNCMIIERTYVRMCVCVYVRVTSYVWYGNPEVRIVLKVSKYVSLGPVMHCEIGTHRTQGKAVKDGTYVRTIRQLAIPIYSFNNLQDLQ